MHNLKAPAVANAFSASGYPNPYANTVTIKFQSLGTDDITLTVRNVTVQQVFAKTIIANANIQKLSLPQATAWPLGLYYLTVRQGNQQQVLRMSHR